MFEYHGMANVEVVEGWEESDRWLENTKRERNGSFQRHENRKSQKSRKRKSKLRERTRCLLCENLRKRSVMVFSVCVVR